MSTLLFLFTAMVYVMPQKSVVLLKSFPFYSIFQQSFSPPACTQGQTAVSLHCDTWVIQSQSLNGTAKAWVLRLVHWIHAWGPENKSRSAHQHRDSTFHLFRKHWLHLLYSLVKHNQWWRGFTFDPMSSDTAVFTASIQLYNEQTSIFIPSYYNFIW